MNLLLTRLDTYFTGSVQLSLSLWVANLALVGPLPVLSNYSVARVCYNAVMFDNLQFNTSFVSGCQKCTIIIVFVMESRRSCANSPLSSRRFSSVRLFQPIPSERIVPRLIWRPNVTACLNDFSIKLNSYRICSFFSLHRGFFLPPPPKCQMTISSIVMTLLFGFSFTQEQETSLFIWRSEMADKCIG